MERRERRDAFFVALSCPGYRLFRAVRGQLGQLVLEFLGHKVCVLRNLSVDRFDQRRRQTPFGFVDVVKDDVLKAVFQQRFSAVFLNPVALDIDVQHALALVAQVHLEVIVGRIHGEAAALGRYILTQDIIDVTVVVGCAGVPFQAREGDCAAAAVLHRHRQLDRFAVRLPEEDVFVVALLCLQHIFELVILEVAGADAVDRLAQLDQLVPLGQVCVADLRPVIGKELIRRVLVSGLYDVLHRAGGIGVRLGLVTVRGSLLIAVRAHFLQLIPGADRHVQDLDALTVLELQPVPGACGIQGEGGQVPVLIQHGDIRAGFRIILEVVVKPVREGPRQRSIVIVAFGQLFLHRQLEGERAILFATIGDDLADLDVFHQGVDHVLDLVRVGRARADARAVVGDLVAIGHRLFAQGIGVGLADGIGVGQLYIGGVGPGRVRSKLNVFQIDHAILQDVHGDFREPFFLFIVVVPSLVQRQGVKAAGVVQVEDVLLAALICFCCKLGIRLIGSVGHKLRYRAGAGAGVHSEFPVVAAQPRAPGYGIVAEGVILPQRVCAGIQLFKGHGAVELGGQRPHPGPAGSGLLCGRAGGGRGGMLMILRLIRAGQLPQLEGHARQRRVFDVLVRHDRLFALCELADGHILQSAQLDGDRVVGVL